MPMAWFGSRAAPGSQSDVNKAESIARDTDGVKGVKSTIKVNPDL